MNGIKNFTVKFDEQFNGKIQVKDKIIFLSSVFKDRAQLTKYGQVISNPIENPGYTVEPGEYVWFHHNIAGDTFVGTERRDSQYLIDRSENTYTIPPEMIYAYTKDGEVVCPPPYCFIEPVKEPIRKSKLKSSLIWLPGDDLELDNKLIVETDRPNLFNMGRVFRGNKNLEEKGVIEGDLVICEKDSEYPVNIHGKEMWRMREEWIYGKYGKRSK